LQVSEFTASLFAGEFKGSGRLGWQDGWRLSAKLKAKSIDATKLARGWFRDGHVGGELLLVSAAATSKELLPRASLSGSFAMERGALAGVDLDKVLQDRGIGEESRFESLRGNLAVEGQAHRTVGPEPAGGRPQGRRNAEFRCRARRQRTPGP
jgi:hypothetical protein